MVKSNLDEKVFGIGLNKTGTTTLGQCGRILGYHCTSCNRPLLKDVVMRKDLSRVQRLVDQYNFFEDWPWPLIYKEIDGLYPGSKFILTTRKSPQIWLNSLKKHSMKTGPFRHCRKLAYGYSYPFKREKEYMDFYLQHNMAVRNYFKYRENDFLEICWENGDNFEKLCRFLNKDVPHVSLPHANKASDKGIKTHRYFLNKIFIHVGN